MKSKGTEFEELKKLLKPVVEFVEEFAGFKSEVSALLGELGALLGELAKQIQGHLALIQEYRNEVVTQRTFVEGADKLERERFDVFNKFAVQVERYCMVVDRQEKAMTAIEHRLAEFTSLVSVLPNKFDDLNKEQRSILQQFDLLVKGSARLHQIVSQLATAMVLQVQTVSTLSQAMSDLSTPWLIRWLKKKLHL